MAVEPSVPVPAFADEEAPPVRQGQEQCPEKKDTVTHAEGGVDAGAQRMRQEIGQKRSHMRLRQSFLRPPVGMIGAGRRREGADGRLAAQVRTVPRHPAVNARADGVSRRKIEKQEERPHEVTPPRHTPQRK